MIGSSLGAYFTAAAGKLLTAVEIDNERSHQHELNGVGLLADLFGSPGRDKVRMPARFLHVTDDLEVTSTEGSLTWYDARARHPTRSEYRLYYSANGAMELAQEGDLLVIARPAAAIGQVAVIVASRMSSVSEQLQVLFGLEATERLDVETAPDDRALDFTARRLLEALGYETARVLESRLDEMLERFGGGFPQTAAFSEYARSTADADALNSPDDALLVWMEQEESLYRTLERHLVSKQLSAAGSDVDEVLSVSMRTFQRRRSRAGHALENHVAHVFDMHRVAYERQARTEGYKRPDFLFPGRAAYADLGVASESLHMLGVKTTCKDRWRQVLTEADRIVTKHLLTLEAPISEPQLAEMGARNLVLVVPAPLHQLFVSRASLMPISVGDFLSEVLSNPATAAITTPSASQR